MPVSLFTEVEVEGALADVDRAAKGVRLIRHGGVEGEVAAQHVVDQAVP